MGVTRKRRRKVGRLMDSKGRVYTTTPQKFDSPIWVEEIAWERYNEKVCGKSTLSRYSEILCSLLKTYPEKKTPADFLSPDIEDWAVSRGRLGKTPATVAYEVNVIRSFWNWMGRRLTAVTNPAARRRQIRSHPEQNYVSVEAVGELLSHCHSDRERTIVTSALEGCSQRNTAERLGLSQSTVYQIFERIRLRSGFGLRLPALHPAYCRVLVRLGEQRIGELLSSQLVQSPNLNQSDAAINEP